MWFGGWRVVFVVWCYQFGVWGVRLGVVGSSREWLIAGWLCVVGVGGVVGRLSGCISGGWAARYEGLLAEWSRRWWWCGAYAGADWNVVVW